MRGGDPLSDGVSVEILEDGTLKLEEDLQFSITDLCGIEIRVCVSREASFVMELHCLESCGRCLGLQCRGIT